MLRTFSLAKKTTQILQKYNLAKQNRFPSTIKQLFFPQSNINLQSIAFFHHHQVFKAEKPVNGSKSSPSLDEKLVSVTFVNKDGTRQVIKGRVGQNILTVAHEHDIDLEGACEGSLACSTCHVIVSAEYYKKLPEPSDEENDMLDLAFGLTQHSRLGCQIVLKPELDGMIIALPVATRNMAVDGYVAKHH